MTVSVLFSQISRFSSFPVFLPGNSAYDINICTWKYHYQIPRGVYRPPNSWQSVSSFCHLLDTLSLWLPVIPKPYEGWEQWAQDTILPLRLLFAIGWSFEMCVQSIQHPLLLPTLLCF